MDKERKKSGPKPKPTELLHDRTIHLRLTESEYVTLADMAWRSRQKLAAMARMLVLSGPASWCAKRRNESKGVAPATIAMNKET